MSANIQEFVWKYIVETTKCINRTIVLSEFAEDKEIARFNMLKKMVKLSKYGVPCFYYDATSNQMILSHTNDNNFVFYGEYYVIDSILITYLANSSPTFINSIPSVSNYIPGIAVCAPRAPVCAPRAPVCAPRAPVSHPNVMLPEKIDSDLNVHAVPFVPGMPAQFPVKPKFYL
jgi:hypothetical protein